MKAGRPTAPCLFLYLPGYSTDIMNHTTFLLVPNFRVETFTIEQLELLTHVLQDHHVNGVKFTAAGRLRVAGIDRQQLDVIAEALQPLANGPVTDWITTIQSCPGKEGCRYGTRNGEELAARIEAIILPVPPPAKIKIGIAGCSMCCTEPYVRDIGLLAEQKGWKLIFGGNAAGRPRIGDTIAEGLRDDEVIELVQRCLTVYVHHAKPKMRTARFMEYFGVEAFHRKLFDEDIGDTNA
ncbi:Nitrite and sulphite reductase 4Fe-4S domain-containing protein [Desulfopila aestuarii DSM 18488]|uniref:Nitrite and sulphite reductase 4Fe-4S domain-containing protein n=2 Tax=Desulfopila aestuarii TaxID=231440 RepID=A0A1M7YD66_9BACT|nr:Nitrite and sulphite reductase 4Fe-4S domain-containing protein [Desulfopila aestuarii DSM 18488]